MYNNITFQYYDANIKNCKPIGFVSLDKFLKSISNPKEKTRLLFEKIQQAEQDKDFKTKSELKKQLYKFTPCVHVNNWRNYKNIVSFTGLLVLDFDHLEINEAINFKQVFFDSCSFIIACWLSPSKHGVKALVKIPICKDIDEFKSYFLALENEIGTLNGFDKTVKNCVLDLFLSYDAELLQRTDATTWNQQYFEPIKKIINAPIQVDDKTDFIVKIVVNKINSITNEGHPILRAVSYSLGGYVGAGYISENDAVFLINQCIDLNNYLSQKATTYKKTALTMIKKGAQQPLYFENSFNKIEVKKNDCKTENISRITNRIERSKLQCKDLENTFIQASKSVKWEWIEFDNIGEPQGKNRLQQLIYLTS